MLGLREQRKDQNVCVAESLIGHLLAPDVNWLGALGFYFLYPVGVVILSPSADST